VLSSDLTIGETADHDDSTKAGLAFVKHACLRINASQNMLKLLEHYLNGVNLALSHAKLSLYRVDANEFLSLPKSYRKSQVVEALRSRLRQLWYATDKTSAYRQDYCLAFQVLLLFRELVPESAFYLALCCLEGFGISPCPELAYEILQPLVTEPSAQALLALYHFSHSQDFAKANELLQLSMEEDDLYAHLVNLRCKLHKALNSKIDTTHTAFESYARICNTVIPDSLDLPMVRALADIEMLEWLCQREESNSEEVRRIVTSLYRSLCPFAWHYAAVHEMVHNSADLTDQQRETIARNILHSAEARYLPACRWISKYLKECDGTALDERQHLIRYELFAAAQNCIDAQSNLGQELLRDQDVRADASKAMSWTRHLYHQVSPRNQIALGISSWLGLGRDRSYEFAFEMFSAASRSNDAQAYGLLGMCYEEGKGTSKHPSKAFECYLKGAALEDSFALYKVGRCYLAGIGVEANPSHANEYFWRSARKNDSRGWHGLGLCHYKAGQYDEAIQYFLRSAKLGNEHAMFDLALCYENGMGTPHDEEKAFEWYHKAASLANPHAQYRLGRCFEYGIGTEKDAQKAFTWYQTAAKGGSLEALECLGKCYVEGLGVKPDTQTGFELVQAAASKGYVPAYNTLGTYYLQGCGVVQDFSLAFEYFSKATRGGHLVAKANLAELYLRGWGTKTDKALALKLFGECAEQQVPKGLIGLGNCYQQGIGELKPSASEAFTWYMKAAEIKDAEGQYLVAKCLYEGNGVRRNVTEALEWASKSAAQGYMLALLLMAALYESRGQSDDLERAVELYTELSRRGDRTARCKLGLCYYFGRGVKQDYKVSAEWLRNCALQGEPEAQCYLGLQYLNGLGVEQDEKSGYELLTKSAAQGFVLAEYHVTECKANGRGVEHITKPEAYKLFAELAKKGLAEAQFICGEYWRLGYAERTRDPWPKAKDYYSQAAKQGHAWAMYRLAVAYENGRCNRGAPALGQALLYYTQSANRGHSEAQYALGQVYQLGKGVKVDLERAFEYYSKSAAQNNGQAYNALGTFYENGWIVDTDPQKAFAYYQTSAKLNVPAGMCNLGRCYECGIGTEQNYESAVSWYDQGAQLGHLESMARLGYCYFFGLGTEQNYAKAYTHFTKGAEGGYVQANFGLALCYRQGRGVAMDLIRAEACMRKFAQHCQRSHRIDPLGKPPPATTTNSKGEETKRNDDDDDILM